MVKTLTDLSQLTKAILKESHPSRVEPAPAAQPVPTVADEDREAEEVLAYFSRTPQNAPVAQSEPTKPTLSKTPSDYRASLNTASDTANRCF